MKLPARPGYQAVYFLAHTYMEEVKFVISYTEETPTIKFIKSTIDKIGAKEVELTRKTRHRFFGKTVTEFYLIFKLTDKNSIQLLAEFLGLKYQEDKKLYIF